MRAIEFLIEYDRNKTAQTIGSGLIPAFAKDMGAISGNMMVYRQFAREVLVPGNKATEADKADIIQHILQAIEEKDPTPNKEYTQWLARMYAKGGVKLEDLNRGNLLGIYNLGKKRRMIKPEHADINRFKNYKEFEDTMLSKYDLDQIEGADSAKAKEKGQAKTVFDNEQVRIVVPEDEAAACYYGRGTRWCTAATKGTNYFKNYSSQGKLYILIPKHPEHEGEKYQIHFQTGSFMDEDDSPVNAEELITKSFGDLSSFFKENEPAIENSILFADDDVLTSVITKISQIAMDKAYEDIAEWEHNDDYYYRDMRELYGDEDGDIDWDAAYAAGNDYMSWNPDAKEWVDKIDSIVTPSPRHLKAYTQEMTQEGDYDGVVGIDETPSIISDMLLNHFRDSRDSSDNGIAKYLFKNVLVQKKKDGSWDVDLIERNK